MAGRWALGTAGQLAAAGAARVWWPFLQPTTSHLLQLHVPTPATASKQSAAEPCPAAAPAHLLRLQQLAQAAVQHGGRHNAGTEQRCHKVDTVQLALEGALHGCRRGGGAMGMHQAERSAVCGLPCCASAARTRARRRRAGSGAHLVAAAPGRTLLHSASAAGGAAGAPRPPCGGKGAAGSAWRGGHALTQRKAVVGGAAAAGLGRPTCCAPPGPPARRPLRRPSQGCCRRRCTSAGQPWARGEQGPAGGCRRGLGWAGKAAAGSNFGPCNPPCRRHTAAVQAQGGMQRCSWHAHEPAAHTGLLHTSAATALVAGLIPAPKLKASIAPATCSALSVVSPCISCRMAAAWPSCPMMGGSLRGSSRAVVGRRRRRPPGGLREGAAGRTGFGALRRVRQGRRQGAERSTEGPCPSIRRHPARTAPLACPYGLPPPTHTPDRRLGSAAGALATFSRKREAQTAASRGAQPPDSPGERVATICEQLQGQVWPTGAAPPAAAFPPVRAAGRRRCCFAFRGVSHFAKQAACAGIASASAAVVSQ